jgi:hypothetical protein
MGPGYDAVLPALMMVVWVAAVVDWARTDVADVRTFPKGGWVVPLLLFTFIGAIAWFVWGHPWHRDDVVRR